jgi:hypothetical protein
MNELPKQELVFIEAWGIQGHLLPALEISKLVTFKAIFKVPTLEI